MPYKLKFESQVFQFNTVSLYAWLLRGYYHEHPPLPDVMPGESRANLEGLVVVFINICN